MFKTQDSIFNDHKLNNNQRKLKDKLLSPFIVLSHKVNTPRVEVTNVGDIIKA